MFDMFPWALKRLCGDVCDVSDLDGFVDWANGKTGKLGAGRLQTLHLRRTSEINSLDPEGKTTTACLSLSLEDGPLELHAICHSAPAPRVELGAFELPRAQKRPLTDALRKLMLIGVLDVVYFEGHWRYRVCGRAHAIAVEEFYQRSETNIDCDAITLYHVAAEKIGDEILDIPMRAVGRRLGKRLKEMEESLLHKATVRGR